MKLDSIFKALDVNTISDIETLSTYFMISNNTDLNTEYKQYNEKINNRLLLNDNGNSSSQSSLRPGSGRNRSRSHTISYGMASTKKLDDSMGDDKSESDIDKITSLKNKRYSFDTVGSLSSNPNDDKKSNSSIQGNHLINVSKNSSNSSINNQNDDYGLIDPSDTMLVIKKFLRDQKRNKIIDQLASSNDELLNEDDFEKKLEIIDKNKKKNRNSSLSSKAYEQIQKDYWERMTNIIDDKRYRLWKVLILDI